MKSFSSVFAATCGLLATTPALAGGPVGLTTGFERIESISHVRVTTEEQTTSFWRAGLGTNAGSGYSIPRVSLDYSWESGLSLGAAFGFMFSFADRVGTDGDVFVPRVGYALALTDRILLWPRLGLTIHDLTNPDASHTALSLDLPLLGHDDGSFGSLSVGPYVDIGLGGSAGDADQTMSEFGLTFGVQLF